MSTEQRDNERLLRDLRWLCGCPALLRCPAVIGDANRLLRERLRENPAWDTAPDEAELTAMSSGRDRRLGHYFENLVALLIGRAADLELLTRNLAVREHGRTLGELDMLVHDKRRDRVMHWELTLKFYLGLTPGHWPGPNPADSLAQRTHRLFAHQFPMLTHPVTRHRLRRQGWHVQEQYLLSAGRLFYPLHGGFPTPGEAATGHLRGFWCRTPALPPIPGNWLALGKREWMSGPIMAPVSDNGHRSLASPELADYVQSSRRPVMVWHERDRTLQPGFAIPPDWPEHD